MATRSVNNQRKKSANKSNGRNEKSAQDKALTYEISRILIFAVSVILFLCNFHLIGSFGDAVSRIMFGLFGTLAYIAPIVLLIGTFFGTVNAGNRIAKRKIIAGVILFFLTGILFEFISGVFSSDYQYNLFDIFKRCSESRSGGGIFSGTLAYLAYHFLDTVGTVLVVAVLSVICLIILTNRSFIGGVKKGGRKIAKLGREDVQKRKACYEERRREQEEQKRIQEEELENEKILRMDKKVVGVTADTTLTPEKDLKRDDIHEIFLDDSDFEVQKIVARDKSKEEEDYISPNTIRIHAQGITEGSPVTAGHVSGTAFEPGTENTVAERKEIQEKTGRNTHRKYVFPPLSKLAKGSTKGKDSSRELRETALHLQETLKTFGVNVTITDISQGPSVTRYELQPEQGVKVSKIVGLTDDIKLNLAATDIRIEAPIPGKAAIGIEVPNKHNTTVALRDLLESKEFKEFPSNLAFAVGKDIAGKTVVADIGKMPHMLIAGATGSGKSVCINTLIMSLLYKSSPDEVRLILIDPKVVELSVYNGIPHLLIPVVTDPKKAAAALHWGVAEMEDRYRKFADENVRDLKGYNKKIESITADGGDEKRSKLPQIVIIVDELADLMMVAPGEVEESICRLAQLARAAGIHLIIATQRPSVDVITGLIKANMPSRVAFAVSSGVDSRTILDMNGAEKLLGKGDMLFYPQGYSKPARVQGAFVSDKEVSGVVDFLKNQDPEDTYSKDIAEKIKSIDTDSSVSGSGNVLDERDEYFNDAGRFIIEKDKASIGMLQRAFRIGFNRAARIMDQLCDYGVVGEEEGTKPRKILMSMEQFEQLLEEI